VRYPCLCSNAAVALVRTRCMMLHEKKSCSMLATLPSSTNVPLPTEKER
jgi:hypothetical protein